MCEVPGAESDELLWRRAVSGDAVTFGVLYERHADRVLRHCLRASASVVDADDVASLTFLEAWRLRNRARFVDGSVLPWMLSIATNVGRNYRRSARRHATRMAQLPRPSPEPDIADHVVAHLDLIVDLRTLAGCFSQLPAAQQDVIALCDLSELSYADAAVALDLPIGTVRSRLSRARARLRELIIEETTRSTRLPDDAAGTALIATVMRTGM
jgi:RNA polymerase sigma-70 factor (ECF subfamily)